MPRGCHYVFASPERHNLPDGPSDVPRWGRFFWAQVAREEAANLVGLASIEIACPPFEGDTDLAFC